MVQPVSEKRNRPCPHHHYACVCESSDWRGIWAESSEVLPPQLGCLTRSAPQRWPWGTVKKKQRPGTRDAGEKRTEIKGQKTERHFHSLINELLELCSFCWWAQPDRGAVGAWEDRRGRGYGAWTWQWGLRGQRWAGQRWPVGGEMPTHPAGPGLVWPASVL